jgi:hypothetical protein
MSRKLLCECSGHWSSAICLLCADEPIDVLLSQAWVGTPSPEEVVSFPISRLLVIINAFQLNLSRAEKDVQIT